MNTVNFSALSVSRMDQPSFFTASSSSLSSTSSCSISTLSDISAIKDFYAIVSQVEDRSLKQQIHSAMESIVHPWAQRQGELIRSLNQLERSHTILLKESQMQSTMYSKALQELHFYRTKYDELTCFRPKPPFPPRSSYGEESFYSIHPPDSPISPAMHEETTGFNMLVKVPLSKPPPSEPLPPPPPPSARERENSLATIGDDTIQTPPHESSTGELKFACGDGFWNTIAEGSRAQVDTLVENYLRKGGKPNVANNSGNLKGVKEGFGLIHALIVAHKTESLRRIIDAGANPHVLPLSDDNQISPLVLAAQMGYMNGVRLLIERAHVNILSSKGPRQENALLAAIQAKSDEVVDYLLHLSPKLLDQADVDGATPLHYACKSGKPQMITLLVRNYGQMTDVQDYRGETPLHYAIRNKRTKAVFELVSKLGANPNSYVPKKVVTPLDLAKQGGLHQIADYLKKVGGKTRKEMDKTASLLGGNDAASLGSSSSMHSTRTSMSHESAISVETGSVTKRTNKMVDLTL